jgi:MazG family protein
MPIPPLESVDATAISRLRDVVARLRAPVGGCPWDLEQTHRTLRAALIEESYELLAAIDAGDDENLREELGDLLLHVVMHAQIAAERGAFDFDAVATGIAEKMVRRHPHVFGTESASDSDAVLLRWEEIKRREKSEPAASQIDGVPDSLPALQRAQKIQAKAARVGFDWQEAGEVLAKVREELAEVEAALSVVTATVEGRNGGEGDSGALADELGDLLFSVVNLARWQKLESELLLRRATDKFSTRFRHVEMALRARGQTWEETPFSELDALWEAAKVACRRGADSTERKANSAV